VKRGEAGADGGADEAQGAVDEPAAGVGGIGQQGDDDDGEGLDGVFAGLEDAGIFNAGGEE